jgi:hypothetical protein
VNGHAVAYGGDDMLQVEALEIDVDDAVLTSGIYRGLVDFNPGPGLLQSQGVGAGNMYLSKLDADGNLAWAHAWPGFQASADFLFTIDTQPDASVFTGGSFRGVLDLDPGPGVDQHSGSEPNSQPGAVAMRFEADGTYVWGRTWPAARSHVQDMVALDDHVLLVGYFTGTIDLDPGLGVDEHTASGVGGGNDAFLLALDLDGNYAWAQTWGEGGSALPTALAVDAQGDITVVGWTSGPTDLEPGVGVQIHDGGLAEAMLARFDAAGNWQWAIGFGGDGNDVFSDIAFDSSGEMVLVGSTSSTSVDFDASEGEALVATNNYRDAVVLRLGADGSFVWLATLAGEFEDRADALHIDCDDQIYVAGDFYEVVDFDPGEGVAQVDGTPNINAYVWSLTPAGEYTWAATWDETSAHETNGVGVTYDRRVVTALNYQGEMDFNPGPGVELLPGIGGVAVGIAWLRMDSGEFF